MDAREHQTVVLGALLHDIGKLLQRGSTSLVAQADIQGKHPAVSSVFISAMRDVVEQAADPTLLRTLVQRHHESHYFPDEQQVFTLPAGSRERALAALVSLADNLSSKERGHRSEQIGDEGFLQQPVSFRHKPLASVFGSINIEANPQPHWFHPRPLSPAGSDEAGRHYPLDGISPWRWVSYSVSSGLTPPGGSARQQPALM